MSQPDCFVHPTAIVAEDCVIGKNTRIWHFCHIMPRVSIGEQCVLGQNVFVASGVTLGRLVKVQNNVSLYTGVVCHDEVFIGPSAVFTNVINPRSFIERKAEYRPTVLHRGASVGANATIICGTTVGQYAMIGAGAVVTRDVPDFALVTGNPARQRGWVSRNGHKLRLNPDGTAHCPETNERYQIQDGRCRLVD